ncbi:polysaccharide deacetylase family protein [Paenibacillus sp. SC116]|uniref:polysaccharide deacetylase family protein n=1 Tax=Paenibacillus sp. SC116 TaxID=2968986 RepID=UPI00215B72C8|nr:polysaccharide deacetylase family protein [Paenibacillus sp. SC116]MCR8842793.1 polysaccharide deacetylase family protein [Paenibacillus sp. SC116]
MAENIIDFREFCENPELVDNLDHRIIRDVRLPDQSELYVCFTFDDGPTEYTSLLLDLFKQYDAKATFFVVGEFVDEFPDITRRIVEEGHQIGNHTYFHPDLSKLTIEESEKEIKITEAAITTHAKTRSQILRPPYGVFRMETVERAEQMGYRFALWSRDMYVRDWEYPGADVIVQRVLDNMKNGSIVLLHDGGGDREQTVEAVKQMFPILLKKGYKFVTISELIELSERN